MKSLFITAIAICLTLAAAPVTAADVSIELNKLEQAQGACRSYLVLRNGTPAVFETMKLDLVLFDQDGIVARRLAVEMGPLPSAKTSLKVFNIDGVPCDQIGGLLLNDVIACADAGGPRTDCLTLIETSARGSVTFFQ